MTWASIDILTKKFWLEMELTKKVEMQVQMYWVILGTTVYPQFDEFLTGSLDTIVKEIKINKLHLKLS